MNITKFILEHVTKLKVFYDKGYEYYGILMTLVSMSILVGVWLPYIQEGFALLGVTISKLTLSIVLTLSMFFLALVSFVSMGWLFYKKSIPQMEWVYRDLQHPIYVMTMMNYRRMYSMMDELAKSTEICLKVMERNKFGLTDEEKRFVQNFTKSWTQIKENFPIRLQVGDKVIVDAETISYEEMKRVVEKARSIK